MSDDLFNPPSGLPKIWIGIDPGEHTGIAIYSKADGLKLQTLTFWKTIDFLSQYILPRMGKEADFFVVIETPQYNNFMYGRNVDSRKVAEALRIARNVGMNQGDAKRLTQFLKIHNIPVEEFTPGPRDQKWPAPYFKHLTGIETAQTAEHVRDAARFISRFWIDDLTRRQKM